MEISFATDGLKDACLARQTSSIDLPANVLRALQVLYNVMRNAEHLAELPLGGPNLPMPIDVPEWRADLADGYRVLMRVNHITLPSIGKTIDSTRVRRVQFMAVEAS
jgi:hypothetical protein